MDFTVTDEQQLLKDTLERYLVENYEFRKRREYVREPHGWSDAVWGTMAELGLLGLPFSQEDGGLGMGPIEVMIVMEVLGRFLVIEPYLSTVVLCGGILRYGASVAQRQSWVPRIAAGELRLALAHTERHARYELAHVETRATARAGGYRLDGSKCMALHADSAQRLIVSARVSGGSRDPAGVALFLVDAQAQGVKVRGYATQDGMRAADIVLDGVEVAQGECIGEPGSAMPVIERTVEEVVAALCAEAVGSMAEALRLTVEHLKNRQQFGVPIGSFQALQHRASEMFIQVEQARSMALYATAMAASDDAVERATAVSAAKVQIGRSGRFVGQQAVQLHGGIGMTMEHLMGHHFKRLSMIDAAYGDVDHHLRILAACGGLIR